MLIELTGERKQQVNYSVKYNQDSKFKDKVSFGLILWNIAIDFLLCQQSCEILLSIFCFVNSLVEYCYILSVFIDFRFVNSLVEYCFLEK